MTVLEIRYVSFDTRSPDPNAGVPELLRGTPLEQLWNDFASLDNTDSCYRTAVASDLGFPVLLPRK